MPTCRWCCADRIRSREKGFFGYLQDRGRPAVPGGAGQLRFVDRYDGWQRVAQLLAHHVGNLYNAEALEKSVEEMQIEASRRGYAFAVVRPRGDRNFEQHTVSITFAVDEGPRTYIERINIRGNTRTRDFVIRREFDLSEGDAYNAPWSIAPSAG